MTSLSTKSSSDRPLAKGESYSAPCETQWTAAAGAYKFLVIADDVNRFAEANEYNNWMETTFFVAGANK